MELKEGYKMTEVGVIPEDWVVYSLGEIFGFKNGLNKGKEYFGSGTPIVNYMDVYHKRGIKNKDIKGKVSLSNQELKIYDVRKGDVFFTRTSETVEEIGLSSVILEDVENTVFSGFILRARPLRSLLDLEFCQYCFSTMIVRKAITSKSSYTTRALTNGRLLSKVKIPIPTLSEQTAIATALSDMDALITNLEQLIAKKRSIKQGVMQELLTGKRRLPGFGGEWIPTEFGQVMEGFSSGQTPYRAIKDYYKGSIPWITSGELNYNVVRDTNEKITEGAVQKTNLKILPVGTFLMAITGLEAAGTRGSCAITGVEATTNQSCMALFPKADKLTTSYLFHYYVFAGNELALKYCQGTKQQSYTGSLAKKLPISLPSSIEEQQAISSVLDDLDTEITALTQKLTKLQLLKQGMMQNLLTGKIRLI